MRTRTDTLATELTAAPAPAHLPIPARPAELCDPASPTAYLDANGYDPADYRWVPVRRKPRADGWSDAKQRRFIEALADGGSVGDAARAVGMSASSAYRLRRAPGSEAFARAWDAAIAQAVGMLVDVAFERAINGSVEPVFDRDGRRVGSRHRGGDRLLMFLLAAHYPDRYGRQRRRRRSADDTPGIADALARLAPVEPVDPAATMLPADLDVAIEVADLGDGTLPGWLDEDRVAADPVVPPVAPYTGPFADDSDRLDDDLALPSEPGLLGEAFEIALARAKRHAASGMI